MSSGSARRRLALSLLLASFVAAVACAAESEVPPHPSETLGPTITIRDRTVSLEITSTRAEQAKGLGGRDSLAWNHGMLFEYPSARFPGFWMKDMRFDIDIVWIRAGRIVDISHRVRHYDDHPGPTIKPRELVDTVLEVPAGYAQAHRWRIGDRVTLDRGDHGTRPNPS